MPSSSKTKKKTIKTVEPSHFTGKRRLRFRMHGQDRPEPEPEKRRRRADVPDVVEEQIEDQPYQTDYCPEAMKDVKLIRKNPENYLEINVVKKSRVVDVFCIPVEKKSFHYKKLKYEVKEDGIYLMPTKTGLLMPSSYYREGNPKPAIFQNTNKGITGRALTLLYKEELYRQILFAEDPKYNIFIVILLIAILICFGIGAYFVFVHGGGIITPPSGGGVPVGPA